MQAIINVALKLGKGDLRFGLAPPSAMEREMQHLLNDMNDE